MNDEVKEILKEMKTGIETGRDECNIRVDGLCFNWFKLKMILDYITNLQQENNNLKTSLDESQEVVVDLQQENERLKLNRHQLKQKLEAKNKRIKMIKDILNGRSDE